LTVPEIISNITYMSKELKKLKGAKNLATEVENHPNFLKLGKRGLKKSF